jgi:hypothetical protein
MNGEGYSADREMTRSLTSVFGHAHSGKVDDPPHE